MIYPQTFLKVADNSGAKFVKCLRIIKKGTHSAKGKQGDFILVSIRKLRKTNRDTVKVKIGDLCCALIIRTKTRVKRRSGFSYTFFSNAVVLLTKQLNKPVASRIIGPLPRELKLKRIAKLMSISAGTL